MDPLYKGSMDASIRAALERQRDALLARLQGLPHVRRGSVYERPRQCGRPTCACATGGPKHRTRQLTVTLKGTTHTRNVRRGEVERVQALIAGDHTLWAIVAGLTAGNLALLRGAHPGGRSRPRQRR